ncbi:hypothetical protein AB3X96_40670 [Paraburkholderia sp. BR13439]|uniref:hypothetical protein n=1 Tax=unclassified Paraburkholderia TaxID=2615204 RepID=UPI0034CFD912
MLALRQAFCVGSLDRCPSCNGRIEPGLSLPLRLVERDTAFLDVGVLRPQVGQFRIATSEGRTQLANFLPQ